MSRPYDQLFRRYIRRKLFQYGGDIGRVSEATGFSKSAIYKWLHQWSMQSKLQSRISTEYKSCREKSL
jgi:transposase-like protein